MAGQKNENKKHEIFSPRTIVASKSKNEHSCIMSLLRYLKRREGLPDPRGSLSNSLTSRAISRANAEVEAELEKRKASDKKRGPYKR